MKVKIICVNLLLATVLLIALAMGVITPAYFSIGMIILMLVALITESFTPELSLVSTVSWLLLGAFIHNREDPFFLPENAFSGFSNPATVTIALLFLIAASVKRSGLLDNLARWTLGGLTNERFAVLRMAMPLASLSAFFNNTPIVTIFLPIIKGWCREHNISSSKLLIPLSYLTIFGGTCTLIGTSTNLVINGLYVADGHKSLGLFDFAYVGIPCAIVGVLYLSTLGSYLLPDRLDSFAISSDFLKSYLLQMRVKKNSRLIDMSIHDAGLRDLEDRFLIEIHRSNQVIAPVRREMILQENDLLVFSSSHQQILDLHHIEGLSNIQSGHLSPEDSANLIEVVISSNSTLDGKTIEEVWFNRKYDATVLALHRNGHQIIENIAMTPLKPGDTLLLLAGFGFKKIWQDSQEFLSVSLVDERRIVGNNRYKPLLCLLVIASMVIFSVLDIMPILYTSIIAVFIFLSLQYLPWKNMISYIDWNTLIVVASSFGISSALSKSGASKLLADNILNLTNSFGNLGLLVTIFLVTNILTEIITNNAAVALVYPIALSLASSANISAMPLIMTVAVQLQQVLLHLLVIKLICWSMDRAVISIKII